MSIRSHDRDSGLWGRGPCHAHLDVGVIFHRHSVFCSNAFPPTLNLLLSGVGDLGSSRDDKAQIYWLKLLEIRAWKVMSPTSRSRFSLSIPHFLACSKTSWPILQDQSRNSGPEPQTARAPDSEVTTHIQVEPTPQNDNLQASIGLATPRPGKGCRAGSREERHERSQNETQSVQIWASRKLTYCLKMRPLFFCGHHGWLKGPLENLCTGSLNIRAAEKVRYTYSG